MEGINEAYDDIMKELGEHLSETKLYPISNLFLFQVIQRTLKTTLMS